MYVYLNEDFLIDNRGLTKLEFCEDFINNL